MNFKTGLILLVFAISSTGCATLFKGTSEVVSINSSPSGASVYVDGGSVGKTPMQLSLESKRPHNVEIRKDGYESSSFTISNSVGAGWVILDVLGGLIPVIIDASTGAFYSLNQTQINANLEQKLAKK